MVRTSGGSAASAARRLSATRKMVRTSSPAGNGRTSVARGVDMSSPQSSQPGCGGCYGGRRAGGSPDRGRSRQVAATRTRSSSRARNGCSPSSTVSAGIPRATSRAQTAVASMRGVRPRRPATSAGDWSTALHRAHDAVRGGGRRGPGPHRDGHDGRGRHGRRRRRTRGARRRQPGVPARPRRPARAGDPGPRDGRLHHPGARAGPRRRARRRRARDCRPAHRLAAVHRRAVQHGRRRRHRRAARRG